MLFACGRPVSWILAAFQNWLLAAAACARGNRQGDNRSTLYTVGGHNTYPTVHRGKKRGLYATSTVELQLVSRTEL